IKAAGTGTGFALRIADSTPTDRLVVLDKGYVGIGTTNPVYELDVTGSIRASSTIYGNLATGPAGSIGGSVIKDTNADTWVHTELSSGLDKVIIATAGSHKLAVTSDGNVGIGLTNPAYKLDINGSLNVESDGIRLASSVPSVTTAKLYNDSTTLKWNGSPLAIGGSLSGTERFLPRYTSSNSIGDSVIYQTTGNDIGIGLTNPAAKLDILGNLKVSGTSTTTTLAIGGTNITATAVEINHLSGVTSALQTQLDAKLTKTLTSAQVFVGNGSNVAAGVAVSGDITIDNAGVTTVGKINGISLGATSAPSGALLIGSGTSWVSQAVTGDVTINNTGVTSIGSSKVTNTMLAGSIAASKLISTDIATVGTITSGIWNAGALTSSGALTINGTGNSGIAGNLGVGTTAPVSLLDVNAKLNVLTGGNVGIGTTLPAYKLDVEGDIRATGTIYGGTSGTITLPSFTKGSVIFAGTGGALSQNNTNLYWDNTATRLGIGTGDTAPLALLQVGTSPAPGLLVTAAGNVGIGTTAPTHLLDVSGTARISGNVGIGTTASTAQKLFVDGTVKATNFSGLGTDLTGTASGLTAGSISSQGALATLAAVSGGTGGTITDSTITAADLAAGDFSTKINSGTYSIGISGTAATATNLAGGTAGALPFQSASATTTFDASNLYWDNATKRLGIGTSVPLALLQVGTSPNAPLVVTAAGQVGVGTTSPGAGFALDVVGALRSSNGLTVSAGTVSLPANSISHTSLSNIGTNTHTAIDTFISSKAAVSGLASLDANSLVVQNPANANATATASKIPIADGSGKLDTWITLGASLDDTKVPDNISIDNTRLYAPAGAGNLGIGTTAPAAKLDLKAAGTATGVALKIQNADSVDKLIILDKGWVGIGTTPAYALQVEGDIRASGAIYGSSGTQVPVGTGIGGKLPKWSGTGASSTLVDSTAPIFDDGTNIGIGLTNPASKLEVAGTAHIRGAAGITGLVIDSAGNIGIGVTASSANKLQVAGTIAATTFSGPLTGNVTGNLTGNADTATNAAQLGGTAAASYALLTSPTFTGTPTLPTGTIAVTQAAGDSTTAVATTAFVTTADNLKANLASPTFSGSVTMPGTGIWKSDGNVGIGTTNPARALEITKQVVGETQLRLGNTNIAFWDIGRDGTSGQFSFKDQDGTYRMVINQTTGNVGIGTTGPNNKLEVAGNVAVTTSGTLTVASTITGARFVPNGSTASLNSMYLPAANTLGFSINSVEKMRIDSQGNVGIGTTGPQSKLAVLGGISVGTATYTGKAAPTSGAIIEGNVGIGTTLPAYKLQVEGDIRASGNIYGSVAGGYAAAGWVDDGAVVRLQTDADNVGIGLTNPTEKLQVAGNLKVSGTSTTANLTIGSLSGVLKASNGVVTTTSDNSANWDTAYTDRLKWDGGATGLTAATGRDSLGIRGLNSAYTSDNALYIKSDGNVGIGLTNPVYKLDINGSLNVESDGIRLASSVP
ncbi:MAG: hypothetical protein WC749_12900, partial [Dehalococcoidia bacterium]